MTESTTPAQCRDEDWNLARDCGLMAATPGTNEWDAALGRFADGLRAAPTHPRHMVADHVAEGGKMVADSERAEAAYDTSVVKRIATQMGWTPPSASPAALTDEQIFALWDEAHTQNRLGPREGNNYRRQIFAFARALLAATPSAAQEARDAERYRKLRDGDHYWYIGPDYDVDASGGVHGYNNHSGDALDAAVDAMSTSKEGA